MKNNIPLTPRYAIGEKHGNQDAKIRLADDFRASATNAIVQPEGTNIPENLDVCFAVSSYLGLIAPGCDVECATLDFPRAYKNVPNLEDQREFASILIAPPAGSLKVATLRAQPFGSRRAPANWSRVTNFAKWILLELFGIAISVYAGDIFILEPAGATQSAVVVAKIVREAFGFPLEMKKE